ncbi:Ferredoxin reductase [Thioalkalivibrio nitratireducens DSM 14787]|uniref:Ferredoxin reductase n=1 Tax=Thioalkalivibrio nitratireducens (strain DSM 14787 / UNIQEM 213 / ALEN2) TaxID=1255043 RepID=L0DYJ6_THIND|nr:hypothetical protein [Thioalkalivibrio nitratireducens]AGA34035.1 Ferredoxin reductase [Thioalkalivibrio nitratireducens DSM 14787]
MARTALLHQLIEAEGLESERYRDVYVHLIHAHEELKDLAASSKMNAEWGYLVHLKDRGRAWADRFLKRRFDDLGVRSTFDLGSLFTDSFRPPGAVNARRDLPGDGPDPRHQPRAAAPRCRGGHRGPRHPATERRGDHPARDHRRVKTGPRRAAAIA